MPLDPSISLQAGQGVTPLTSPLAMASQYQGLSNAMAQNRLINANVDSTVAGTAQTQQATSTSKQAQTQSAQMAQAQGLSELAALPTQYRTQGAAMQLSASNLARGIITPEEHDASVKAIQATGNQQELDNLIHAASLHQLPPAQKMAAIFGADGQQSDGQSITPGTFSSPMARYFATSLPAFTAAGQSVAQYPSREALMGRVVVKQNADGSQDLGPIANVTSPGLAGPAAGGGLGTGRFPDALRNPNNRSSAPPPSGSPGPGVPNNGNVTVGIGGAATAAQSAQGTTSAQGFADISKQGQDAVQQRAIFQNMAADTTQFTPGFGQQGVLKFKSAMQRLSPTIAAGFGINPNSVAANESFDKLAAQLANAQGASSDARMSVNQAGNPHSDMSPAAIDMILRQLTGNSDYLTARARLAAVYPNKADRPGFEAGIGQSLDPRVFQFNNMTPEQKTSYYSALKTPTAKAAFQNSYQFAQKNGLLGASNAGQ